ncbi:MAG: ABC transporter permease [Candidatus Colwellbacteria bacterium]|nr:ABC transporter permease [Candidatus Colwellbacteria bacterium]
MHLRHSFKIAYRAIKINKSRSFLTILGILIGIAAIMMMVSLGSGAEELILGEISGFGGETIVIRPGDQPTGFTSVGNTLVNNSLKERDIELLRRKGNVPYLKEIVPFVVVPGSASYEGETYRPFMLGGDINFFVDFYDAPLSEGNTFTENDTKQLEKAAVIGYKVRQELFGASDAVGKYIQIKDQKFKVVGVLAKRGQVAVFDIDELVVIPHTTAQKYILGIDYYHEFIAMADDAGHVDRTIADIEKTLRESHKIDGSEEDDFFVVSLQGAAEMIQTVISTLTAFLSSVVAIALVVGGVGVMNIMLVSITERTREIGLKKAVGATEKEILQQFLFEAILLTFFGGLIGIILGGIFSFLISVALAQFVAPNWSFSFPFSAILLGMGVTTLVGLVFGLYPARKAARKDPIEALRYE